MRRILAVSGGIDSVVMLHYFREDKQAIVAHFNHGIRSNSKDDQIFVQKLANQYDLTFVTKDANLGANTSEADARAARYAFLNSVCKKYDGKLCVAHHRDDIYESIAINLLRGTGWRGLAPFRNVNIERPLLDWQKSDVYRYATDNNLSFRQDQSNTEEAYLRNRVRNVLRNLTPTAKDQLYQLYLRQCELATEIEELIDNLLVTDDKYINRNIFQQGNDEVAMELLRELLLRHDISQTRPQLRRILAAIKEYLPGKKYPLGKDSFLQISKYHFSIKKS